MPRKARESEKVVMEALGRYITRWLHSCWYQGNPSWILLFPLEQLFKLGVRLRYFAYHSGLKKQTVFDCPVIVVGNLSVGGTGKTPLVIWVVNFLRANGFKPGVISRGYGGKATAWPQEVTQDSNPRLVGDEAVVIARQTECPITVGPWRVENARKLLSASDCDILVSDDGLQHYALGRDVEISVVDGERRHGNGRCLPAGPLRESLSRLSEVDCVVCNGNGLPGEFNMTLEGSLAINLKNPTQTLEMKMLAGKTARAVAAIGNPQRFFKFLRKSGLEIIESPYPDHHLFEKQDIVFDDDLPVFMTEKDAVKCLSIAKKNYWWVPVQAKLKEPFGERLLTLIKERKSGQQTT